MSDLIVRDRHYHLHIHHQTTSTYIQMQMISPLLTTTQLPHTHSLLSNQLPTIHSSRCFNDALLPFTQEVRNTEIGHLFEHILLEYIYQMKILATPQRTLIKGKTSWNWQKDPHGLFHISVNSGVADKKIFLAALKKSIRLLNKILD